MRGSDAASVEPAVEAEPSERENQCSAHGHRHVVSRQRADCAVAPELSDARADHVSAGERHHSACHVHDRRPGEIDMTVTQAEVNAELREPSAAPDPVAVQRVEEHRHENSVDEECFELPSLRHRAGRNGGGGVHENQREQKHAEAGGIAADVEQRELAEAEDAVRMRADRDRNFVMTDRGHAERRQMRDAAHHEAVAGEPETEDADRIDDQVHRHGVDRVFRARKTRLDHRESELHEHHEETSDQQPREVQRIFQRRR